MEKPTSLTARRPPKFLVSPLISRKDWIISSLFALFSQLPARNFSHICLRELTPEFDNLWNFIVSEILFTEADNLLFRNLTPRFAFQDHIGLDVLTHLWIRHSHDTSRLDLRMLEEDLFDMSGEDRISLILNEISFAIEEVEVTFLIHADKISSSKPLLSVNVDQCLPGSLLSFPIALHDVRPVQDQFSNLTDWQEVGAFVSDNGGLHAGQGHSKRTIFGPVIRATVADGSGLSHP